MTEPRDDLDMAELRLAMWAERDRAIGCEATVHRLEVHIDEQGAALARLEQRVKDQDIVLGELEAIRQHRDAMLASPTWRVGRAVMSPVQVVRRLVRRLVGRRS